MTCRAFMQSKMMEGCIPNPPYSEMCEICVPIPAIIWIAPIVVFGILIGIIWINHWLGNSIPDEVGNI